MFTGLIEEIGNIITIKKNAKSSVLQIRGNIIFEDIKIGDSISVNGVCLTVTSFSQNIFMCDVMEVTLKSSSLGYLTIGSNVNLERAMQSNGRFGGHIVTGHIDGTGKISNIIHGENSTFYTICTDKNILKYIIKKGSVAIDGISLTVVDVRDNNFDVSIIPHTAKSTILHTKNIGSIVNLENDVIGKYIERLMYFNDEGKKNNTNNTKIDEGFLTKFGFL
ncbi:MAG: riboflavin synthase [Defluviitaleaceae bacterium]|nr:riboflavin synthase [Defluviitaleaceae bacterium]